EEQGYEVVREYVDDAISGTSAEERPGFQRMIADARTGPGGHHLLHLFRPPVARQDHLPRAVHPPGRTPGSVGVGQTRRDRRHRRGGHRGGHPALRRVGGGGACACDRRRAHRPRDQTGRRPGDGTHDEHRPRKPVDAERPPYATPASQGGPRGGTPRGQASRQRP
ncbi:MAG: recombinase family protein, partial [Planctomycetes bacterium]|nr:recombinase family protein [Planctomycetota bacterium]